MIYSSANAVESFCDSMSSVPSDELLSFARWIRFESATDLNCLDHTYQSQVDRASQLIPLSGAGKTRMGISSIDN